VTRWGAVIALLWGSGTLWAFGGSPSTSFVQKDVQRSAVSDGLRSIPYAVYEPRDFARPEAGWPVVLSLHGTDEAGSDNIAQTEVGIGPAVLAHPERFPSIILAPQIPKGAEWTESRYGNLAILALRDVQSKFKVDSRRIYLTGYGRGGFGAFKIAADNPTLFAAVMPICGGGKPEMAEALQTLPIWIFHGLLDLSVSVEESRTMVAALERARNPHVLYSEYDYDFHSIWDQTYGNPTVIMWLFDQLRIPDDL